jgi:hypothetical protein
LPEPGAIPEKYEDFPARERRHFFRCQPAPLPDPRELGIRQSLVLPQWPFIEEVAFAGIVVFESSRPSGKSLATLAGGGAAGIVSAGTHDPRLLLYGFTSLVIVRVADTPRFDAALRRRDPSRGSQRLGRQIVTIARCRIAVREVHSS